MAKDRAKGGTKARSGGKAAAETVEQVVPQLYLITPDVADPEAFLPVLREVLAAAPVAAVLLRLAAREEREIINILKTIAPVVQDLGTALIYDGQPLLAARGGADGVHLPFDPDLIEEAVSSFRGERSVGVQGLRSKDDAMTAGELGADYVFFGEVYSRSGETHIPPVEAVAERVAWWAEMFEVPVVAFAPEMAAIAGFVQAKADFIALADAVFAHPQGPAYAVKEAHSLIESALNP